MPVVADEDKKSARRERRAAAARRRYHANPEVSREACRLSKQAQRQQDSEEFPVKPGRAAYDPQDYADEWMFLTRMGVRSDQIIARSRPSRKWFVQRVLPLVSRSVCSRCGSVYDPREVRLLTRCYSGCMGKGRG